MEFKTKRLLKQRVTSRTLNGHLAHQYFYIEDVEEMGVYIIIKRICFATTEDLTSSVVLREFFGKKVAYTIYAIKLESLLLGTNLCQFLDIDKLNEYLTQLKHGND